MNGPGQINARSRQGGQAHAAVGSRARAGLRRRARGSDHSGMGSAAGERITHVFESDVFIAVDKPAGWLSVPSRWGERDARPCLGRRLEADLGSRLFPVHRLDEEVSGIILFARTAPAHAAASGWFEARQVGKHYEAWTESPAGAVPAPFAATWRARLLRGKKRAYESPHGKDSETVARMVGPARGLAPPALAWELDPVTGRSHQLRFDLARHGYPILGDALYGASRPFLPAAIALRCVRLRFLDAAAARLGLPEALEAPGLEEWAALAGDRDGHS